MNMLLNRIPCISVTWGTDCGRLVSRYILSEVNWLVPNRPSSYISNVGTMLMGGLGGSPGKTKVGIKSNN